MSHESFHRYHIAAAEAPPLAGQPSRFSVKIDRGGFFRMAAGLLLESRSIPGLMANFGSRPCIYGVYDNPFGGLQAEESLCRGCLRCMVEHPDVARIELNPRYKRLGDSCWRPEQILTIWTEAASGRVPVRGMGYGGPFRGEGFDDIWTDMSEIVRPTRDGIHGRETISTTVDVGSLPIPLGPDFEPAPLDGAIATLPLPIVFRALPVAVTGRAVADAIVEAAARTGTVALIDADDLDETAARFAPAAVPVLPASNPRDRELPGGVRFVEWDTRSRVEMPPLWLTHVLPKVVWSFRLRMEPGFEKRALELVRLGATCLHVEADMHGREFGTPNPRHLTQLLRSIHGELVRAALRDRVTIVAGGGITAAEHVPKAILCGADLVAVDAAALVALQAEWEGEWTYPDSVPLSVPDMPPGWAVQRLMNLLCAWRDQLLEIMGAMGLRDVRRLRGEVGRAMFAGELEREVFEPLFGRRVDRPRGAGPRG